MQHLVLQYRKGKWNTWHGWHHLWPLQLWAPASSSSNCGRRVCVFIEWCIFSVKWVISTESSESAALQFFHCKFFFPSYMYTWRLSVHDYAKTHILLKHSWCISVIVKQNTLSPSTPQVTEPCVNIILCKLFWPHNLNCVDYDMFSCL